MANIYCSSAKWTAVTAWAALTTLSVGDIRRQSATPTVGNERVFRVSSITTGITGASEPTWNITANSTTTDSGVTWTECTGQAAFNGDGGGTAWAAPHARTYTAGTFAASGDNVIVGSDHAESQSTQILYPSTMNGTQASTIRFICCDTAAVPPTTLATTATVNTVGSGNILFQCPYAYFYGISFNAGNTTTNATISIGVTTSGTVASALFFNACSLNLTGTNTSAKINLGLTSTANSRSLKLKLIDTALTFSSTSQKLVFGGANIEMIGGSIAATGSVPTAPAISGATASGTIAYLNGVDVSALSSPLFDTTAAVALLDVTMANCNNDAIITTEPTNLCTNIRAYNSGTETNNEKFIWGNTNVSSVLAAEAALSGGTTDGTNQYAFKLVAPANNGKLMPLEMLELRTWNDNTGSSVTGTVELYGSSSLTDKQIWMEVEYYSSGSTTKSSRVSTVTNTTLLIPSATANALTSSSGSWSGTGISGGSAQKLVVTFTPQLKGFVIAKIYFNKDLASNVYINPQLTLT